MHTTSPGHIIDCTELILGIYWHSSLMSEHEVIGICGISLAYEAIIVAGT